MLELWTETLSKLPCPDLRKENPSSLKDNGNKANNSPSAPWYGDWWERIVSSIKQILLKCHGRVCVTYEKMLLILCEGESILSEKPLSYVSENPNEMTAITPSHFIQVIRGTEEKCVILSQDLREKKFPLGEIVLIRSDNFKRLNWPLGHVIELYPGKDGIERVAKLRVANGFVIRLLQRHSPLEISVTNLPSDITHKVKIFQNPIKTLTD
ncbi:integrase catalytic domain-containing protein [Trichonephila inaurata madagascariensis]|uniref:Integrase catalytic domain-containing protein n=1 Tax=Trichonephila inaurata madagascariensis TaxID=2747483 RepID=A0A8X6Y5K1_9ARAC|nr:integrase catalytic domain-containing protein [Trichonephila inaurata madagascariensis]